MGLPGARCRCAPATIVSTSLRSPGRRGAAAIARPPASRRRWTGRRSSRSCAKKCSSSSRRCSARRRGDGVGTLLYDKPAGITSHDAVARVRRALGRGVKVGHAGTLDPFATGLLLILVGRATRVQRFLMALPKAYEATARFGATSNTGDPEGEIVETGRVPDGDLSLPTGVIRQRPPAFSAVKVGGRRAYQLARAGVEVEIRRARRRGLPLRGACARRRPAPVRDRVLVGHIRAHVDRRSR